MSAGTLINYLPAHMVFRTPEMKRIFDGFMPTSTGRRSREIDVPLIQMPTMHEVETNVHAPPGQRRARQQFRLYEFAGIGHVDSRDNVRLLPNPCTKPLSTFLTQAYIRRDLHHLLRWVDEGVAPPRAQRILLDRDESNDGSTMALDAARQPARRHPQSVRRRADGEVRARQYGRRSRHRESERVRAREWSARRANHVPLERVSGAVLDRELRELYGSKREYLSKFEARLDELEREGWSLPVYRDTILADVAKTEF